MKKHPLSVWLAELWFEDNAHVRRRASRIGGLLRKLLLLIPHGALMLFTNFAAAYPRSPRALDPRPVAPAENLELTLDEWPRHPEHRGERGLPYGDSAIRRIDVGDSLARVSDLMFAMEELHRVCAGGAEITVQFVDVEAVAADPRRVRAITPATLAFFAGRGFAVDGDRLRAIKTTAPRRPRKIDLGSGSQPRSGYAGVDILPLPGVEIVADVDRHGLPLADSSITHVSTAHFLEHVRHLVFVMNEIHRVCCHDAEVEINVPTLLGPYAAGDPTHVRLFNARTLSYFEAGSEPYAGIIKGFEILEQRVGLSIQARLRVIKNATPASTTT